MWCVIYILGLALAQDNYLSKGGILKVNTEKQVIIQKDSVLVTMFYDMNEIELMWNKYIENGESLIASIGHNKCVEKVISDSRESRFKIKEFLNSHSSKIKKRQALLGVLGGLTSMVTLGLTTYEISKISEKINEMKQNLDHNEGKIEVLNKVTKYNTGQINTLRDIQVQTGEILK